MANIKYLNIILLPDSRTSVIVHSTYRCTVYNCVSRRIRKKSKNSEGGGG